MGGAIVRGLAASTGITPADIALSSPRQNTVDALAEECPGISTFTDNKAAIKDAEVIILAVKPWVLPSVLDEIAPYIAHGIGYAARAQRGRCAHKTLFDDCSSAEPVKYADNFVNALCSGVVMAHECHAFTYRHGGVGYDAKQRTVGRVATQHIGHVVK